MFSNHAFRSLGYDLDVSVSFLSTMLEHRRQSLLQILVVLVFYSAGASLRTSGVSSCRALKAQHIINIVPIGTLEVLCNSGTLGFVATLVVDPHCH